MFGDDELPDVEPAILELGMRGTNRTDGYTSIVSAAHANSLRGVVTETLFLDPRACENLVDKRAYRITEEDRLSPRHERARSNFWCADLSKLAGSPIEVSSSDDESVTVVAANDEPLAELAGHCSAAARETEIEIHAALGCPSGEEGRLLTQPKFSREQNARVTQFASLVVIRKGNDIDHEGVGPNGCQVMQPSTATDCRENAAAIGSRETASEGADANLNHMHAVFSVPKKNTQDKLLKQTEQEKKQRERQRKAREKETDKLVRQALAQQRKATTPGECEKHMSLACDTALRDTSVGAAIVALAKVTGVECDFHVQPMSNTVVYKRRISQVSRGNDLSGPNVVSSVELIIEAVAAILSADDFVNLVQAFVKEKESSTSACGATLSGYVTGLLQTFGLKPTVIVIGCNNYYRAQLIKAKRKHRNEVQLGRDEVRDLHQRRDQNSTTSASRVDVEECCVDLQLRHKVCVIHCNDEGEAAQTALSLNKAVAEAPYKRDKLSLLAADDGAPVSKVRKDGAGLVLVWKNMLQEFRNLSADVADAVVAAYPSPQQLFQAYKHCGNQAEAASLLENLQIRRGTGALQTMRRVGKELSRRIYELYTTPDPDFIIA